MFFTVYAVYVCGTIYGTERDVKSDISSSWCMGILPGTVMRNSAVTAFCMTGRIALLKAYFDIKCYEYVTCWYDTLKLQ